MVRNSAKVAIMVGGLATAAVFSARAATPDRLAPQSVQATSVTGCLQQGADKNTFSLTAKDGKKYDVTSKAVPLHNHVGHTVTITGTAGKTPTSLDAAEIKHVSPTCS